MQNEETKTEPTLSLAEEARQIRDEIIKAKEELKAENDRQDRLQQEKILGSSVGGHVEAPVKEEETALQYADRIMRGK